MHLPSTKINPKSRIVLRRVLPVPGDVFVQPGQPVNALTVVAHAEVPSGFMSLDVARQLGQPDIDMDKVLVVDVGDYVDVHAIIASYRGGLLGKSVKSPVAGHVSAIGPGWILLETERTVTEVQAFINGVVTRIIPDLGAIIEADGAIIEPACGFGGEAYGRLKRIVNSPFEAIAPDAINENFSEAIILGGRTIDEEGLLLAEQWKVRGVIVGSIAASLLDFDGKINVRVVATEGFGDAPMSPYTFGVLTSLSRREISIRGQSPISSQKPDNLQTNWAPIILSANPLPGRGNYVGLPAAPKTQLAEAKVGSKVRIVQGELLGSSGTIDLLPPEPQATKAGTVVPGAYIKTNNEVHFVPWANLKLIA